MATLIVNIEWTGIHFELKNVDLSVLTPHKLIAYLIDHGPLTKSSSYIRIVNPYNEIIESDKFFMTFSQLGFTDGDFVGIITDADIIIDASLTYETSPASMYDFPTLEETSRTKNQELKYLNEQIEKLANQEKEIEGWGYDCFCEWSCSPQRKEFNELDQIRKDKQILIQLANETRQQIQELEENRKHKEDMLNSDVFSSIFAPAEVKKKSHMLVQVYLHLFKETKKVKALAQESDKNAARRDYIPLQCKLKKGDKIDIQLNIYGETLLMSDKKSVVWQGSFTKCSFDYFVPKDTDEDELSCVALLTVNEIPIGEMRFITKIVDTPRQLNTEIIAHKYNKVFISYSHLDESKVKFLHEGLELGGISHFFDRKYLKTGDVFPQVIQDYINAADLFVLCWSKNASKSEYVEKERKQALERAFPQVKPQQAAKLSIYPLSIEPRAELPNDMKENYHFGVI